MHNNLISNIQQVDENTYVTTHQQYSSGNVENLHSISEVEELKMIIRQMEEERNHIIESQVLKALKSQEEEFNQFYKENIQKVEEHFLKEVIPLKIREVESQFYKHQPSSTVSHLTSSSTTLVPIDVQMVPLNFNEEAYLSQKYEQWKLTYLPVILELKEKQWLERYENFELQNILKKKYEEWESIRLLSIIKDKKNQWILDQIFAEKTLQWNRKQQEILQIRIHQVQQYWDQVIFPQRIAAELQKCNAHNEETLKFKIQEAYNEWEKTILVQKMKQWQMNHTSLPSSQSSFQAASVSYTAADLDRILIEQHRKWQIESEHSFQIHLQSRQQEWEAKILPQMRIQLQKQYSSVHHSTSALDTSRIDEIINAKYEEWKHTYLPEYLRLEKIKWLENYTKNQLEQIIIKKQEEWESLRLLAIIRQPRNQWVVESIIKEKFLEWQNTILSQEKKKWQAVLMQKTNEWQINLQREKKLWESTILAQRKLQWEKEYALHHPIQEKQVIIQEVVKQVNIEDEIRKYETSWIQNQQEVMRKKIEEVEKYWEGLMLKQRQSFEKNIQSALQIRTSQIENYWQSVMLPQIRSEWELTQAHQLKTSSQEEDNEKINRLVNERLLILLEQKMTEWHKNELPAILEKSKHEWSVNFRNSQEFAALILNREQEWIRERQVQLNSKQSAILSQQKMVFESEIQRIQSSTASQIQRVQSQAAGSLLKLENTLSQKEQEYNELQSRFLLLQRELLQLQKQKTLYMTPKQSFNSKEAIYQLEAQHMKQINQLKLSYQEKLSQINHDKSILLIQIKELQLNLQQAQKSSRPKESLNLTSVQTHFEKQIQSLQATLKTKESQNTFLKKSIDSLTLENQELNSRIMTLNAKISNVEASVEENKNHSVKLQFQIKYLKQKEASFNKKLEGKDSEFSEIKSRLEFEKSLLEKKLRQQSSASQTVSSLQLKITELESQLSLKHSSTKNVENEYEKKKRQLEEEKQRSMSFMHEIEVYKSTIKQHESIIQDLRLEIRKSCDELNRQKLMIESADQKQKTYLDQLKKLEVKTRDRSQFEEIIRENERLKVQISRLREKLIFIESNESRQVLRLKQIIQSLESRLYLSTSHLREGDITEIQILRRINHEISDLVSSNKQLQMRIIVLQNEKELSAFGTSVERFFVAFQQQMDNLINYMIDSQIWAPQSINFYSKFQHKAKQALSHGYVEDYFRQWQSFMRRLLQNNYDQTSNKTKINQLKGILNQPEDINDIVDKYDTVLNDVKFTLAQFLKTGDKDYLNLMSRSLGIDNQKTLHLTLNEKVPISQSNQQFYRKNISKK